MKHVARTESKVEKYGQKCNIFGQRGAIIRPINVDVVDKVTQVKKNNTGSCDTKVTTILSLFRHFRTKVSDLLLNNYKKQSASHRCQSTEALDV